MTLTIEIDATEQHAFALAAAARGVSLDAFLLDAAREMAALDALDSLEDAQDEEDARRILAESEPTKRRTLDELRTELQGRT